VLIPERGKALVKEAIASVNDDVDSDDPEDDPGNQFSLDDLVKPADWPEDKNWGRLSIDATCTLADITYPTDLKLVNEARQSNDRSIDELCGQCTDLRKHRPRYDRGKVRANFLNVAKQKSASPQNQSYVASSARLFAAQSRCYRCPDRLWCKPFGSEDTLLAQATGDQRAAPPTKHPALCQEPQHARPHRQFGSESCLTNCSWQGKSCC